jgi:hypothetical protein
VRKYGNIGLSCTSMAISRKAWEATGFGDTPFCTDKFIQRRLGDKGFRMVPSAGPVVYHGHSYTLRSLIKRCTNEGLGWRVAGAKYTVPSFLYDLTVGFARHAKMWMRAIGRGQARDPATIFFFQIRPICVLIGNRILRNVIR